MCKGASPAKYLADTSKESAWRSSNDKTAYGKGIADETKKAMNAAVSTKRCTRRSLPGDKDFSR